MLKLEDFYDPLEEVRTWMRKPFNINGRTVATNGHLILSVPQISVPENELQIRVDDVTKILGIIDSQEYKPLPSASLTRPIPICERCNGSGKGMFVNCGQCDGYTFIFEGVAARCPVCYGWGERYKKQNSKIPVARVEGLLLQPNYFRLIMDEPGMEIAIVEELKMLCFKLDEQVGAIMALAVYPNSHFHIVNKELDTKATYSNEQEE